VAELEPLALAGEDHLMVAGDAAAAQRREADPARAARAGDAVAAPLAHVVEGDAAAFRRRGAEQQGGAGRRVDLVAMVHLDDLDVPILAEPRRRLAHEEGEQVYAERHVGALKHRHLARGAVERVVMGLVEAGGADQDRLAGGDGGVEMAEQGLGRREIDQHVACGGERGRILAAAEAAAEPRVGAAMEQGGDRLAHSPRRPEDADPCHRPARSLPPLHGRAEALPQAVRNSGPGAALRLRNESRSPPMAEEKETIIHTDGGGGGGGVLLAVVLLIALLVVLFLLFGRDLIGGGTDKIEADVKIETPKGS
jgi:hypothetical protein